MSVTTRCMGAQLMALRLRLAVCHPILSPLPH
jgi:hypothetical protein